MNGHRALRPTLRITAAHTPGRLLEPRTVSTSAASGCVSVSSSATRSHRLPGLDAVDGAPVFDSQSHVENEAAAGHAPDGVEVGLDELGDLCEQQGEPQDELAQRLPVERGAAAQSVQLSGDALGG